MTTHRLALVIPTKDRPESLRRLLESVIRQSRRPSEVVIVDGGTRSLTDRSAYAALSLRSVTTHPPSLTRQKNLGIDRLSPDSSLVGFLDDDLILEDGAIEAMLAFWDHAGPEVGGAGFTIQSERPRRGLRVKRMFALDAAADGRLLPSGYNTPLRPQPQPYTTQWLSGGAGVWRREVVEAFRFDEWFAGYSYLEDVDYSIRVGRRYQLVMVPAARVEHAERSVRLMEHIRLGIWQVTNRLYVARKHPELSVGWCVWSLLGQMGLNATVGVGKWGLGGILRTIGNGVGWVRAVPMCLGRGHGGR